jgi:hypothetical protein
VCYEWIISLPVVASSLDDVDRHWNKTCNKAGKQDQHSKHTHQHGNSYTHLVIAIRLEIKTSPHKHTHQHGNCYTRLT